MIFTDSLVCVYDKDCRKFLLEYLKNNKHGNGSRRKFMTSTIRSRLYDEEDSDTNKCVTHDSSSLTKAYI